ncbi:protein of unknown function [Pseudomonas sp. JV551A1]|uniref:Uncharacterized protein n=1 Tax=Pseudomonas inefficax TaxID=2078786 RepID=A0AAQ1SRZ3_9PSED|nr:protein of unknown function [Pseudomonas sp. JV551A1]SPO59139.1 protein of unknown function [Pseudomonas inefficax]
MVLQPGAPAARPRPPELNTVTCGSGFTRECVGSFTAAFAGKPAPTGCAVNPNITYPSPTLSHHLRPLPAASIDPPRQNSLNPIYPHKYEK